MLEHAGERPDLVIRRARIVDGTGQPPFIGDVAVIGDKITAVGPDLTLQGKREFDARGLVVAPGWVDCHTHFDAQATWDPYLTPSTGNGVTTAIFGNCGIGFAPCQKDRRDFLAHLVEAVEDIPGRAIAEGMVWDWETFEEYMDSLGRREYACDIALMIGHSAVRTWVLGDRANLSDRPGGAKKNPVQEREIQAMAEIVRDGVAAGALGFSTSRLMLHRDKSGALIPGTLAQREEVLALARAVAQGGGGVFQMTADFVGYDDLPPSQMNPAKMMQKMQSEVRWMLDLAKEHGEKVGLTWAAGFGNDPATSAIRALHSSTVERIIKAGGRAAAQGFVRPQGFLMNFSGPLHPFMMSPTFQKLLEAGEEGLLERLQVPENRDQVIRESQELFSPAARKEKPLLQEIYSLFTPWDNIWEWTPSYEPSVEESVEAVAKSRGLEPLQVAFDIMLRGVLWKPYILYPTKDHEPLRELLEHPHVLPGGGDGGAHGTTFTDATGPTHLLTHWVRDRSRGPKLPIELAVRKHSKDVADFFGLRDRGVIAPGMKADLNVVDLEKLRIEQPHFVRDLPLGAGRWLQGVEGYVLTVVSGCVTYERGEPTGSLPGCLVRNPRREASAWQGAAARYSGSFSGGPAGEASSRARALEGAGSGGASSAGRLLREFIAEPQAVRSKL